MKKTSRKALSLFLAVLMLCSIMSVTAFASPTDPEITVYFTRGNFTTGGYDFANDTYIPSVYQGTSPAPDSSTAFASDMFVTTVKLSEINTTFTRSVYSAPTSFTANPNALDVIITAINKFSRTPYGNWDSYNYGGYIEGFLADGSTDYYGYTEYYYGSHLYYNYTGTNWQIAYNTTIGGNLYASSVYGTGVTNLFDGMVIVFDLSTYNMYYQIY
jgi:hypothetical protein